MISRVTEPSDKPSVEATKIILKQDHAAAPVLTEAFSLSGEEEKLFTTRPSEVTS
jgi:hypothetical protein